MGYYPIFLKMSGRPCVVIGGGAVAEHKVEGLLHVGAHVTIVSPSLTSNLASLVSRGKVRHIARQYRAGDLKGYILAFVATNDHEVNADVAKEGQELGVWVNAADDPAHCNFILPAVVRRGELAVAVSTGGASPALARAVREELEKYFSEDYAILAALVAEVRKDLKRRSLSPPPEAWQKALNGKLRDLIRERDRQGARTYLRSCLESAG